MAQNGAAYLQQQLQTPQDIAAWNQWVQGVRGNPVRPQVATLDAAGEIEFQNQIAAINNMSMMQGNQNAFQVGQQRDAYTQRLLDMRRKFKEQRAALPSQFMRRGLFNSGLTRKTLGQLGTERDRQLGGLRQWNAGQLAGLQQAGQMNRAQASFQLANLRAGRAGRIVNTAIGGIGQGLQ